MKFSFSSFLQILETLFALYSTFATIFNSYNNPIISYYDYDDYLTHYGKSLTNSAVDTVDVEFEQNGDGHKVSDASNNWAHKTQRVLQFVLNAIEKGKAMNSENKIKRKTN